MEIIQGGVCAAKGFKAAGVHCGIRRNPSKKDLALIISEVPCSAAAVYTTNLVKGAPILLDKQHIGTMNIKAKRNAYGRQLGSFSTTDTFKGIGPIPMTFIRAPYIESVAEGVEVLSEVDGRIVAARQGKQLVTAFHPELDSDLRVHDYFLKM